MNWRQTKRRYGLIVWNEFHSTLVFLTTKHRRSRRSRRAVRAAKRGDLVKAWRFLVGGAPP